MKPVLVQYKADHLMVLKNRDTGSVSEWKNALHKEYGGPAFSALLGDRVIGCAGIIVVWDGVGYAWASFSDDIQPYGLWMTRVISRVLQDSQRALNLHRIETTVLLTDERNLRWIRLLGFSPEMRYARAYTTDKRDVQRFEYVRDEVYAQEG